MNKTKLCGVYRIYNTVTNCNYIGSSTNIKSRWTCHLCDLRHEKHKNKKLQEDFNLFGEDKFLWQVLEVVDKDELIIKEIEHTKGYNNIYNMCEIRQNPDLSEEVILRFLKGLKFKENGCWAINSYTDNKYSTLSVNRVSYRAHRISYLIFNGPYDYTKIICHKCQNKECVNPEHLFIGTQSDNMIYDSNAGVGCKINLEIAKEIKTLYYEQNKSLIEIQDHLKERGINITKTGINQAALNKTFHDPDFVIKTRINRTSQEDVVKIRDGYLSGISIKEISKSMNIKICTVFTICENISNFSEEFETNRQAFLAKRITIGSKVEEIRNLYLVGVLPKQLAVDFNIQLPNMHCICGNRSWYSEEYGVKLKEFKLQLKENRLKLVNQIRELYLSGEYMYTELAKQFDTTDSNITLIAQNKTFYCEKYAAKLQEKLNNKLI